MPVKRVDILNDLKSLGKTRIELCNMLDIDYRKMNGIINGYWKGNESENLRIKEALKQMHIDAVNQATEAAKLQTPVNTPEGINESA